MPKTHSQKASAKELFDFLNRHYPEAEYHAVYENPNTGDRVALIITPVMDPKTGVVQNHIDLLVGNANNDPLDRARISRAVAQSLRNSGAVENCSFPCSDRFGDQTPEEAERAGDIAALNGETREYGSVCRMWIPKISRLCSGNEDQNRGMTNELEHFTCR